MDRKNVRGARILCTEYEQAQVSPHQFSFLAPGIVHGDTKVPTAQCLSAEMLVKVQFNSAFRLRLGSDVIGGYAYLSQHGHKERMGHERGTSIPYTNIQPLKRTKFPIPDFLMINECPSS